MMTRLVLVSLLMLNLAAPLAAAADPIPDDLVPRPECIQVYPWSELCGGDVVGFACFYVQCEVVLVP